MHGDPKKRPFDGIVLGEGYDEEIRDKVDDSHSVAGQDDGQRYGHSALMEGQTSGSLVDVRKALVLHVNRVLASLPPYENQTSIDKVLAEFEKHNIRPSQSRQLRDKAHGSKVNLGPSLTPQNYTSKPTKALPANEQ